MFSPGQLVKVAGTSPGSSSDGIVFSVPSAAKVVVAVVDRTKGPVMRTVNATAVTVREEAATEDHALRLLIRRTPRPAGEGARGTTADRQDRSGFKRGAAHRTTGR